MKKILKVSGSLNRRCNNSAGTGLQSCLHYRLSPLKLRLCGDGLLFGLSGNIILSRHNPKRIDESPPGGKNRESGILLYSGSDSVIAKIPPVSLLIPVIGLSSFV